MNNKFIEYSINIFIPFIVGSIILYLLNYFFGLVTIFGNSNSYVYYYTFSTIVQGFVALGAFLGTLAVFKLQRDENRKDPGIGRDKNFLSELANAQRLLTFDLKKFAVTCLYDVGFALIGIPLIPIFNLSWLGPIYLGGNIVLSLWALCLSYPIIQTVLNLEPKDPFQGG